MLTRKNYKAIADIICKNVQSGYLEGSFGDKLIYIDAEDFINDLNVYFTGDNSRFNKARFWDGVGPIINEMYEEGGEYDESRNK